MLPKRDIAKALVASAPDGSIEAELQIIIASTIANFTLSSGNSRFYITGDYSGYVISYDNQYDVNLCYRGMRYNFSFTGGEFIESDITRFISSVRFD